MMINTSKEDQNNSPSKKEGKSNDNNKIITKASSSTTTTSTPWLRLRDPRIVRVSRAFGGKDRHSKVCTIRGLRDRRVRLSVPTAIQLYDLQDRLGLNQPSKVVDWLLNAAKHEIDELPPLPMLPMNLSLHHQALFSSITQANKEGFGANISNWEDQSGLSRPNFWNNEAFLRANKSKEVAKSNEDDKEESSEEGNGNNSHQVIPSNSTNLFPRVAHSSSSATTGLINNSMPYGSFFQLEHPNFPFGSHGFTNQGDELHNLNAIPLPSTLSLSSGAASQVLVAPQAYFPNAASTEIDPRQLNHFQMLASSSTQNFFPNSLAPTPYSLNQSPRPLHFSLTPRLFHSLNSGNHHQPDNKEQQ